MFFFVEIAAVRLWAILIIIKHACEDPEIVSMDDWSGTGSRAPGILGAKPQKVECIAYYIHTFLNQYIHLNKKTL